MDESLEKSVERKDPDIQISNAILAQGSDFLSLDEVARELFITQILQKENIELVKTSPTQDDTAGTILWNDESEGQAIVWKEDTVADSPFTDSVEKDTSQIFFNPTIGEEITMSKDDLSRKLKSSIRTFKSLWKDQGVFVEEDYKIAQATAGLRNSKVILSDRDETESVNIIGSSGSLNAGQFFRPSTDLYRIMHDMSLREMIVSVDNRREVVGLEVLGVGIQSEMQRISDALKQTEIAFEHLLSLALISLSSHEYAHALSIHYLDNLDYAKTFEFLIRESIVPEFMNQLDRDYQTMYLEELLALSIQNISVRKSTEKVLDSDVTIDLAHSNDVESRLMREANEKNVSVGDYLRLLEASANVIENLGKTDPPVVDNYPREHLDRLVSDLSYRSRSLDEDQVKVLVGALRLNQLEEN